MSEPVTQATLRITGAFWRLDAGLARRRHFPAINWNGSYSLFTPILDGWYRKNVASDFPELRQRLQNVLQEEAALQEVVQLVGPDALQDNERLTIEAGRMLRQDFLQQNGFDAVDASASMPKNYGLMKSMLKFYDVAGVALKDGATIDDIIQSPVIEKLSRARYVSETDFPAYNDALLAELDTTFKGVKA